MQPTGINPNTSNFKIRLYNALTNSSTIFMNNIITASKIAQCEYFYSSLLLRFEHAATSCTPYASAKIHALLAHSFVACSDARSSVYTSYFWTVSFWKDLGCIILGDKWESVLAQKYKTHQGRLKFMLLFVKKLSFNNQRFQWMV